MKFMQYLIDFAIRFVVVLIVNLIVKFLYGLIVHGTGILEWETSITFAISLGIILTWIRHQEKK